MKNGQLGVGERIEDAFVVGPGIPLVLLDRAELAFSIENVTSAPDTQCPWYVGYG